MNPGPADHEIWLCRSGDRRGLLAAQCSKDLQTFASLERVFNGIKDLSGVALE
jgi:hypothetical protein